MNSHEDIRRQLAAYCDGELEPAEKERLEQHLADCPACRAELDDVQTAVRLLRSTPDVEPPPWLTGRIMARITEQQGEKKGWLQRFFFPLHIKLPLEVAALLMVCVTGYYLSRSVETGLRQEREEQFQEVPAQLPVRGEQKGAPAATKPPAPASRPLESRPAEQGDVPQTVRPQQVLPAPPLPAPAPSAGHDQSGPKAGVMKALPSAESFNRTLDALPERKAKSSRRLERSGDAGAPAGGEGGDSLPAVVSLPVAMVRLSVTDPIAAPAMVREAALRSGGTVTEEPSPGRPRLGIRLPAERLDELLARLEKLGKISERPASLPGGARFMEITIQW